MSQIQAGQLLSAAQQYLKLGQFPKAIELLQRSLAAAPGSFAAHSLLGIAYQTTGDFEQAVVHLRAALALQKNWAEGHELLGRAFASRVMYEPAVEAFHEAVRLKPQNVEALNNLGTMLKSLSRFEEAIVHLQAAAKLRPNQAEIHNNLGNALLENGQTAEALVELELAVALRPDYVQLYQGLGNSLVSVGRIPEAIECFRKALKIDPSHHQMHSSLLLSMHYTDEANTNPIAHFEEHRDYDRRHIANPPRPTSYLNDPSTDRRLRLGYFSPDFRRHSVSFFIEPVLAHHDQSKFEIFCYADVTNPDAVTARLQKSASQWRNVCSLTDAQIAEQIRTDRIDILVDLSGHTGGGRLPLFGRKPAPVQVSYLGYPNTTGLATMDYRITDSVADPPGDSDLLCSEKLVRLDPIFLCFQPPAESPEVAPPPLLKSDYITFGSFNTLAKITPGTIALWSAAMNAVARSRMLIKARGLQHSAVSNRLLQLFESHGIAPERLVFLGHETTTTSHLARYHEVDIALDSFPYNGTTTTCEALWMGVPVITMAGKIHAARVGASLLTALSRVEWISQTSEQFAAIARELATDRMQLTQARAALRSQFQASPITDAQSFARRWEAALQKMVNGV